MKANSGNVLFMILIAVALFAALSYAVTSSTRNGSASISRDEARILASQMTSELNKIKFAVGRLYVSGNYDQVFVNSAPSGNGTVYAGSTGQAGRTIGIFSADGGIVSKPSFIAKARDPLYASDTRNYEWYSQSVRIRGVDVGTSLPDEIIRITFLSDEVCKQVNAALYNREETLQVTQYSSGFGYARWRTTINGTESLNSAVPEPQGLDFEELPACVKMPTGDAHYYFLLKER